MVKPETYLGVWGKTMKSSFKLGEILGIPFLINYSWFIIFVVVTVLLAMFYFPPSYPDWAPALYWVVGLATSLLFFGSVLGHELAHSMVARSQNIPVKSITLFVFGGVSRITKEATRPGKEAVLAFVGPFSSVIIGAFFLLVFLATRNVSEPISALAGYLAFINFLLAAFNMIPGFPMDGGRVLRSFLWWITGNYRRATRIASLVGQGIAYAFIFGGVLLIFLQPQFWITGAWFALIGWFLENAASSSYRQMMLKESLQGFKARDLMTQDCALVPSSLSIRSLVNDYILPTSRRCFVVSNADRLQGLVTLQDVKKVSQENWDMNSVNAVMTPLEKMKSVSPDDEASTLLEQMDEMDINQMPVVEDGKVVGMVARENIIRFIRNRADLGM